MTEERKSENALRKPRVDVVIPTYKPGKKFSRLLKMLEKQILGALVLYVHIKKILCFVMFLMQK